jgi:tRNA pseudouridine38-40 synthase
LSSTVPSNESGLPVSGAGLVRVRLDISYDGTDFNGWAVQPRQRTVQEVLQDRLRMILRLPELSLTVAGRTDAGVHATGQVAHFDVDAPRWRDLESSLPRRLAAVLPVDVRVTAITEMPADFEARFGALWRRYTYRATDVPTGADPLRRREVLAWPRPLDVEAMSLAARGLLGEHNFAAFCRKREGATTIRTLETLQVQREGTEILFHVQADAFCYSMVRSLVGALLAVGDGRRPPDWPVSLLSLQSRADTVSVAPAHGLTLVAVGYPDNEELAARAALTRRRRDGIVLEPRRR